MTVFATSVVAIVNLSYMETLFLLVMAMFLLFCNPSKFYSYFAEAIGRVVLLVGVPTLLMQTVTSQFQVELLVVPAVIGCIAFGFACYCCYRDSSRRPTELNASSPATLPGASPSCSR